jgi:transcriptional regulator with XRE-family HTH domain
MERGAKRRHTSPSIQIILEQLKRLGLNKADLAKRLGVSQDYVYRILNGRIAFPHARETLEGIARVCEIDPYALGEYRTVDEALSVSARLIWQRMREKGLTREALYQALDGRISRPYFYSILRGDQPFPSNRAYIQLFALALELPPTAFREFGQLSAPRWAQPDIREREEAIFQLFFDKMMADHGFARHPVPFEVLDSSKVLEFFLPKVELEERLNAVLMRMGDLDMGFRELSKVCGVPGERLRLIFTHALKGEGYESDLVALERALHLAGRQDRSELSSI